MWLNFYRVDILFETNRKNAPSTKFTNMVLCSWTYKEIYIIGIESLINIKFNFTPIVQTQHNKMTAINTIIHMYTVLKHVVKTHPIIYRHECEVQTFQMYLFADENFKHHAGDLHLQAKLCQTEVCRRGNPAFVIRDVCCWDNTCQVHVLFSWRTRVKRVERVPDFLVDHFSGKAGTLSSYTPSPHTDACHIIHA